MNYDNIELPPMNKGKSYREYLRDAKLKPYEKHGPPIISYKELSHIKGVDGHLFNGPRKKFWIEEPTN